MIGVPPRQLYEELAAAFAKSRGREEPNSVDVEYASSAVGHLCLHHSELIEPDTTEPPSVAVTAALLRHTAAALRRIPGHLRRSSQSMFTIGVELSDKQLVAEADHIEQAFRLTEGSVRP